MNLIHIAIGDLRRVAKDWKALLWMVAMPLVFAYIFGSAFRGGNQRGTWIPVIDLDRTEYSRILIDQIKGDGYWIDVKGPESQGDLKKQWPFGIVIPKGFGSKIESANPVKIQVVKGNGASDRFLDVQARLSHAIVRFTQALITAKVKDGADKTTIASMEHALAQPQLLTAVQKSDSSLRPPPSGFYLSLTGMLIMFVTQMVLIYGGVTLVTDRIHGQMSRLLTTPTHPLEVYIGKVLARVFLAMIQAGCILLFGVLLFKMDLGRSPLFLLPVIFSLAAFAGSLSILGGMMCQTEKQVIQLAIFAAMILSALSGCWWPIEIVPDAFKTIALCTPTYWALHGLQSVMYFNKSYEVLLCECPILLGFAVSILALASRFKVK